jgi:hypothetical protein
MVSSEHQPFFANDFGKAGIAEANLGLHRLALVVSLIVGLQETGRS